PAPGVSGRGALLSGSEEGVGISEQRAVVEALRGGCTGVTRGGPSLRLGLTSSSTPPLGLGRVQALLYLFLVADVVQLQEPVQDFGLDVGCDGEANALGCGVKPVLEVEIRPAIGLGGGLVHLDVRLPDCLDICSFLGTRVHA